MSSKMTNTIGRNYHLVILIIAASTVFRLSVGAQALSPRSELAIGQRFEAKGKMDSALICYRQAERAFLATDSVRGAGECMNSITTLLTRRNEFAGADSLARRTLLFVRSRLGDSSDVLATTYTTLGYLAALQDQFADGVSFFLQALTIRRHLFGESDITVADCYFGLGVTTERKGDQLLAEEYYEKARDVYRGGNNREGYVRALLSLGSVYETEGRLQKSIAILSEAEAMIHELHLDLSYSAATCEHYLTVSYRSAGEFDKALGCERKALSIALHLYGRIHLTVSAAYTALGDLATAVGDFDSGISYYREALSIDDSLSMSGTYGALDIERRLANLHIQKGDYARAIALLHATVAKTMSRRGSSRLSLGLLREGLGDAFRGLGKYPQATASYRESLALRGTEDGQAALGELHWKLGLTFASRQMCDSALATFNSSLASLGPETDINRLLRSRILRSIGDCHVRLGKARTGLVDYQRALAALTGTGTDADIRQCPQPPDVTRCPDYVHILSGRAAALENAGFSSDSTSTMVLTTYERITEALTQLREYYSLEGSKFQLEGAYQEVYGAGLETALRRYGETGDPRYRELAFRFTEGNRAAALGDALAHGPGKGGDSLSSGRWRLRRETIAIQNAMEWHELSGDSTQVAALRRSLMTHLQEIDSLAQIRGEREHETISLARMRSLLGERDCLIEYAVRENRVVAFVIRSDTSFIITRTLAKPLDGTVRKMLSGMTTLDKTTYIASANALSAVLIAPLQHFLGGRSRLIIVPDGILNYLPFETLFSRPVTRESADYAALPYLLRRYEVSYAPSSQVFAAVAGQTSLPLNEKRSFLGFAPVFDDGATTPLLASRSTPAEFRSVKIDGRTYQTLPHSRAEVAGIAELFRKRGYRGVSVVDREATKGRFEASSANYGIVHIATHGFFNEEHPQFSGLIFAPGGAGDESHRDVLLAGETYDLNVKGELVVLSSCQSGLGKLVTGEGIVGLTRGFLFSGARNVLYSLWDIRDRNTPQLMIAFYRHLLAGEPYAAALRSAKLGMLNDARTATPLLWAGFVLAGP